MGLRWHQWARDKQMNSGDAEKMESPGLSDGRYVGTKGRGEEDEVKTSS